MNKEFNEQIWPLRNVLFRYALSILKNETEAEDLVQDTLVKLWKKMKTGTIILHPKAMAFTIIKNACMDIFRSSRYKTERETLKEDSSYTESPLNLLVQKESLDRVRTAMASLPQDQHSIMHLKDFEGYSYEEIEKELGISNSNLRVKLSRARKKIRDKLSKELANE